MQLKLSMLLTHIYWNPDPELINVFGLPIRYYGLLFAAGILLSISVLRLVFRGEGIQDNYLDKLVSYGVVGILLGARLGHCLFYESSYFLLNPVEIFLPIKILSDGSITYVGYQGLASHGGALGLLIALIIYSKRTKMPLLQTIDLISIVTGLAAAFIRFANFTNSEIIGKPTLNSWGIIFTQVDNIPRHPAQLYEAISYLSIFGIMTLIYKNGRIKIGSGFFFGLFLTLTFSARFILEFIKENQVEFESELTLNMGQLLSIPYIVLGIVFLIYAFRYSHLKTLQ